MLKKYCLVAAYAIACSPVLAQYPEPNISQKFNAQTMKTDLMFLAGKECQGRGTGQQGQTIAAEYLVKELQKSGFEPLAIQQYNGTNETTFLQKVPLLSEQIVAVDFMAGEKRYQYLKDFYCYRNVSQLQIEGSDIVFLGYGIDNQNYSDLSGLDLENKIVIINESDPTGKKILEKLEQGKWTKGFRAKIPTLYALKPKAVLVVSNQIEETMKKYKNFFAGENIDLNEKIYSKKNEISQPKRPAVIYISEEMASEILKNKGKDYKKMMSKINKKGQANSFQFKTNININITKKSTPFESNNILGYLKGSEKPDELLVISAHYDHLGIVDNQIYYGADDNGSGTTTVLNLARTFANAKQNGFAPKRSILFLFMTGEEKGLLGSEFYTQMPVFPLNKTVADLNVDMVGRIDDKHKDNNQYVYIIGSDKISTELDLINKESNEKIAQKLELDYTYNDENDPNRFYYRSDHYNFAKNGIPIIFYFNGTHQDYHQPTDTPEKIDYQKMKYIGDLVFYTAWNIANRTNKLTIDKTEKTD